MDSNNYDFENEFQYIIMISDYDFEKMNSNV